MIRWQKFNEWRAPLRLSPWLDLTYRWRLFSLAPLSLVGDSWHAQCGMNKYTSRATWRRGYNYNSVYLNSARVEWQREWEKKWNSHLMPQHFRLVFEPVFVSSLSFSLYFFFVASSRHSTVMLILNCLVREAPKTEWERVQFCLAKLAFMCERVCSEAKCRYNWLVWSWEPMEISSIAIELTGSRK